VQVRVVAEAEKGLGVGKQHGRVQVLKQLELVVAPNRGENGLVCGVSKCLHQVVRPGWQRGLHLAGGWVFERVEPKNLFQTL
jgi:hypothetical protein